MSELYLPTKLVEELAEKRAAEMVRLQEQPIPFHDNQIRLSTLTGASGHVFEQGQLLREVKGWVAIGIGAVADRISGLKMSAYVRGRDGEADEILPMSHPSNAILENPNPIFSLPAMFGLTAWWLNLTGQAYYQILHDAMGVPRELWPMPPDRVSPVPADGHVIGGYIVRGNSGQEIRLELKEVVRIWRPDPKDIYQSLGSLAPQAVEFNAERYRMGHVEQTYKNDATPRIVMETPATERVPTKPESEAFEINWREKYHRRRGRDQGVPAWLPPGFKAHELGQTADGSMTVEMGKQLRDQMLSAMGVPGSIVGLVQDVNRAAAETNQYTFDKHGVMPKTKLMAAALTQQLARQFDPTILYKFEEFLAPDKAFNLLQEQSDLTNKVRTINEVRKGRDGLDDVDYGHLPVGSFNDVPYTGEEDNGLESVEDLDAPSTSDKFDESEAITPSQVLNGAQVASIVSIAKSVQLGELSEKAALEIMAVSFGIDESSAKKMLSSRFRSRALNAADMMRRESSPERTFARMIANEKKFTTRFARAMAIVFKAQSDAAVERFRKANPVPRARVFADDLFFDGEFDKLYSVEVQRLRETIYVENGVAAFNIVSPDDDFIFLDSQKLALDQIHADMVVRVDRVTKNRITRALIKGADKGESVDQIARRIKSTVISRKRARTIARTEVGKAAQVAQLDSFIQSEVVEKKQWNTSLDGDVRDSHIATEGQIVGLKDQFTLGSGSVAAAPLDPSLPAEDVINCRCFVTPIFADDGEGS